MAEIIRSKKPDGGTGELVKKQESLQSNQKNLSAAELCKPNLYETQNEVRKLVKTKYESYFNKLSKKSSDEVIERINHWESIEKFLGNRCSFWGKTELPGIRRDGKKIYDWDELKPEEKKQVLVGIPQETLFGRKNGADAFFTKPAEKEDDYGDYFKKTTESLNVLMKLGEIADSLIEKEKKEEEIRKAEAA